VLDFAIECQMDKLAHLVGMDPMEFRILNAYRDGDMKAHRRQAKNCALVGCVQVAAEKAKWPIQEEFRRMSSRTGGGGERARIRETPATPTRTQVAEAWRPPPAPAAPAPAATPAPAAPAQYGAVRFSSLFGTRRR